MTAAMAIARPGALSVQLEAVLVEMDRQEG